MDYGGFGRKTSDLPKDVYNLGLKVHTFYL